MNDRLAVILVSSDRKVLEMGLLFAMNAASRGWMTELKLYLFGPSEVIVATDPELKALIGAIIEGGTTPIACKSCSDKYDVTDKLTAMGVEIQYIGAPVCEAIKEGFVPMTW